MASDPLQRLRSEMALSEAERAELAHDLIQSLDEPRDNGVEDACDREIFRRIGEIVAGQAELVDRVEFRRRMRKKSANDLDKRRTLARPVEAQSAETWLSDLLCCRDTI